MNLTFKCWIKVQKLICELRNKVEMLNNDELPACSQLYSEYVKENPTNIDNQHVHVEAKLKSCLIEFK